MVKDVIRPLPPMAKLDWQRVADAWNFAAEAAEKTPADLAMGAGAVEAIKRHPALFDRAIERPAFFGARWWPVFRAGFRRSPPRASPPAPQGS